MVDLTRDDDDTNSHMSDIHLQLNASAHLSSNMSELATKFQATPSKMFTVSNRYQTRSESILDSSHPSTQLLESGESLQAHCVHGCWWCFSSGDLLNQLVEEVEVTGVSSKCLRCPIVTTIRDSAHVLVKVPQVITQPFIAEPISSKSLSG